MKEIIRLLNPFNNKVSNNKILYTLKILLSTFIIYFISIIIAESIFIIVSYAFGYNMTDKLVPYDVMLIYTFYGYIVTILLFILYTKKINKIKLDKIGLNKNCKKFLLGILFGIITLGIIILILNIMGAIKFNGLKNNINFILIILYFFGYLVQSAMEEIVCRGYLLHRLKERIPVIYAVIISVLFFSIGHFSKMFNDGILIGIIGILNVLLISLLFVTISLKNKNIYFAIGFHFIWNYSLFSIIGLNLSGIEASNSIFNVTPINSFLSGSNYGIESSIVTTIVLFVMLILANLKFKNKQL